LAFKTIDIYQNARFINWLEGMKMNIQAKLEKQDANVKKMAKSLREGARMLDLACPECNNPIFQMRTGEKVCVVCERPVLFEGELSANENREETAKNDTIDIQPVETTINNESSAPVENASPLQAGIYVSLKQACIKKLALLTKKITESSDENASVIILSNTLKVLEILEKLRFL
jgi:uncharacterized Zn finger protein (UPF0148 family)